MVYNISGVCGMHHLIAGAKDLQEIAQVADHVILFGITCGLSAPYVAGQIDYAMNQVSFLSSLMPRPFLVSQHMQEKI